MKSSRMMWVLVTLIVLTTMAIIFGTQDGRSQKNIQSQVQAEETPGYGYDANGYKDMSRYAIADYDEPESSDAIERQKRKLANKRYDSQDWVLKNPHPDTGGVGRDDEITPPEIIPHAESDLIVIGVITGVSAHMSNDKKGVYSEYTIRIDKILKNDASKKVGEVESIIADRMGGFVRYPNGRKVIYELSDKALPFVGSQYVFFLTNDGESPNYKILTLYELKGDSIVRLDIGRNFDEFRNATKSTFIEAINNKILQLSQ